MEKYEAISTISDHIAGFDNAERGYRLVMEFVCQNPQSKDNLKILNRANVIIRNSLIRTAASLEKMDDDGVGKVYSQIQSIADRIKHEDASH